MKQDYSEFSSPDTIAGHARERQNSLTPSYATYQSARRRSESPLSPTSPTASPDMRMAAPESSPTSSFVPISPPGSARPSLSSSQVSSTSGRKARLIYCKAHVAIHPTQFGKDNVNGYLGLVETDLPGTTADEDGRVVVGGGYSDTTSGKDQSNKGREVLVFWVPEEVVNRMDQEDKDGYKKVEERWNRPRSTEVSPGDSEDDGFVLVSVPPPRGEKYAFSVPVSGIYSLLVYPPSLTHWYGSVTFNLAGGVSIPTLYFHDDESPLLATPQPSISPQQPVPRAQWGFPPFLSILQTRATLLKSRLLTARDNRGGELWLVNPSKADREVHEQYVHEPSAASVAARRSSVPDTYLRRSQDKGSPAPYPPKPRMPDPSVLDHQSPKQTLLSSLSGITGFTRKAAQQILSSPIAEPLVPKLPTAVRSFVNVPGEWERSGRLPPKTGKSSGGAAEEFESARLYLARWARVVAEEGERSRKREVAAQAGVGLHGQERTTEDDLASSLGVFSLLTSPNSKRAIPHPTREPQHPIRGADWDRFGKDGRDELWIRREIFRRGFSDSEASSERAARREGWEVLLGLIPWSAGGLGVPGSGLADVSESDKETAYAQRRSVRQKLRDEKRAEYGRLKNQWRQAPEKKQEWKEEWHRIDVDARRTDRTQKIFAVDPGVKEKGEEEKEAGGAGAVLGEQGEEGLNPHIAALREILMTYHTYSPELGYVQGMSDLLSPIYVVFEGNEADAFWGLVGVMEIMESNFLRDQSGMKRQLSTLQQLIGVMDPELYTHLERTDSLNLFFCFRWILINFKREFKFEDVIKLWEVLWTNYYSDHFVLFVALAVLQSHRDVLLRYLTEFDEVLKYANDLSGTIDLQTTLAQAEVLFLSFRNLVEDLDKEEALSAAAGSTLPGPVGEDGAPAQGLRERRRGSVGGGIMEQGQGRGRLSFELRRLLEHWETRGGSAT